jgi:uncharacterized protein
MYKYKVLYHAGCWDGFCAAWLMHKQYPDAEFYPVSYGQPVPNLAADDKVFIVDFSYSYAELDAIKVKELVVLDHHKTCPTDHPCVIFDNTKSGARLTQEYLKLPGHWLIDYTEDRDLWKWELTNSKKINAWLRSYPLDFETWNELALLDPLTTKILYAGEAILRNQQARVNMAIKNPTIIEFEGYRVPCINCTDSVSEVTGALADISDCGWAMTYRDRNGKRFYSLCSIGPDVAEIAKKHGGGGHASAAGFETNVSTNLF